MQIKHQGLSPYRGESNPLEAAYAGAWAEQNRWGNTLGYLLYGQDRRLHDVTQREAEVAATVIQWLGSPVGQSFVSEVLKKNPSR